MAGGPLATGGFDSGAGSVAMVAPGKPSGFGRIRVAAHRPLPLGYDCASQPRRVRSALAIGSWADSGMDCRNAPPWSVPSPLRPCLTLADGLSANLALP